MSGRPSFVARLAWREGRSASRKVGVYMVSITLGVATLVSIQSFRADVARSVREEAESLLGADVRFSASRPHPDSVRRVVDSLVTAGAEVARVTTVASMVQAQRTAEVRLLQVRGVEGDYPFFGRVRTRPSGRWGEHLMPGRALVDPAVLIQLGIEIGDSLRVGGMPYRVAGVVDDLAADVGLQAAIGPRVYLSRESLVRTGLLGVGSLARYETFLTIPDRGDRIALEERYREALGRWGVELTTAEGRARSLVVAVEYLGRYLGLVGLAALLLAGIGVASALHVFAREKLTSVAVLRCLGARRWSAFGAYLLLAGVLGLGGAAAGVAVGVGVQHLLPMLVGGLIPVDVEPRIGWPTLIAGLAVGVWTALLFALVPLLAVKDVPPLRALRADVEGSKGGPGAWRLAAYAALAITVAGLSVHEAPEVGDGVLFAVGLVGVLGILWLAARLLTRMTRRFFPRRARYPVRQGVANLFRPRNQTVAVVLALGFGVFVVGTVLQVQSSIREDLAFEVTEGRPNLLLFDIQPDQVEGVLSLLPSEARRTATVDPVVPGRIAAVKGRTPEELRADTTGPRPGAWALRREYRNTYRWEPTDAETVVAGRWWDSSAVPGEGSGPVPPTEDEIGISSRPARISLEEDLAEELGVEVGDRITWDVGGIAVESEVTSLRRVEWERFDTNFFVVFEPGVLESAPRMSVILARVADAGSRARLQRRLVDAYPNASAVDVTRVQEAVETILGTVDQAIRFLALFCAVAGVLVLAGSLATSRHQRVREGALLKTLGARRALVLGVLFTEYAVLGTLAGLTGLLLATGASALVAVGLFEVAFRPDPAVMLLLWVGVTLLTVVVGLLGSGSVLARPPLPVLREATG